MNLTQELKDRILEITAKAADSKNRAVCLALSKLTQHGFRFEKLKNPCLVWPQSLDAETGNS